MKASVGVLSSVFVLSKLASTFLTVVQTITTFKSVFVGVRALFSGMQFISKLTTSLLVLGGAFYVVRAAMTAFLLNPATLGFMAIIAGCAALGVVIYEVYTHWGTIVRYFKIGVSAVVEYFKWCFEKLVTIGQFFYRYYAGVFHLFQGAVNSFSHGWKDGLDYVYNYFVNIFKQIWNFISNSEIVHGLKSWFGTFTDYYSKLFHTVNRQVSSGLHEFKSDVILNVPYGLMSSHQSNKTHITVDFKNAPQGTKAYAKSTGNSPTLKMGYRDAVYD